MALLGLLGTAILAGPSFEATLHSYRWYTVSPLNPGDGGSSAFFLDAQRLYGASVGGSLGATSAARHGLRVLYVVIGPDRGFTAREIEELRRAYETGNLRILVADDLGVTRGLLEALGAPTPGRLELNPHESGSWQYILTITCNSTRGPASEALAVKPAPGSRVLCRYAETGDPAVVWKPGPGWGGVLVVGDSSIYSNFLYRGMLRWLPSTRRLALYTLRAAGASQASLVIFDVYHYNATTFNYRGQYGVGLLAEGFHSLRSSLEGFTRAHPLAGPVTLTGLGLAMAAILVNPARGALRPRERGVRKAEATAASEALGLLGVEVDESILERARPEEVASLLERSLEG